MKPNLNYLLRWLIFLPIILPIGIIGGAIDGCKNIFTQAKADIFEPKNFHEN